MTVSVSGLGPLSDPDDEFCEFDDGLDPTAPLPAAPDPVSPDPTAPDPTPQDPTPAGAATTEGSSREPVEIVWRGSEPEWVSPHSEWAKLTTGPELLRRVVELVNAGSGRTADDWAFQINLSKIPLHNLREFNTLFQEASAESNAVPNQLEVRTTRHLRAVWNGQRLLEITGDQQWLSKASRQAVSEELSEAARMPETTDTDHSKRDRLLDFIGGTHG